MSQEFKDHIVQHPNRFKQTTVAPGVVELTPTWVENPSEVVQLGTPVDRQLFNGITSQLADNAKRISDVEINVKIPFGTGLTAAKGDGSTDDAAAIQAIVNYAITNKFTVKIPSGTFIISSSIKIDGDNLRIVGAGREKTIIKTTGTANGFDKSNTNMTKHTTIENLSVLGNDSGAHGIKLINVARLKIENVHVTNFINCITEYAWVSELNNVYAGATTNAFNIIGGTSTTFKQCYANTCQNGYVIGDLDNVYGMSAQILQYSTFLNCAADNASEYGYKVLGAVGVNFVNCGSEYVTKGMFYVGSGRNTAGTQIDFNTIVIDNPRVLLNNGGAALTDCFIKNDGRNNSVEVVGLSDASIDGNVTKMIDDITGNSAPIVMRSSALTYTDKYTSSAFSYEKGSKYGFKGESRQHLPISSPNNKMLKATNLSWKTVGNELELFVFAPNDGDMASGYLNIHPLKWNGTTLPNGGRVFFFAQNVGGVIQADINLPGDMIASATVEATSAGLKVFRLWIRMSATTLTTDPYLIFAEVFSDQTASTQRTVIIK